MAIGGLAVGEGRTATLGVLEDLEPSLPRDIPRYLMGVGLPEDILSAVARGVDLFDCVAPTRNGRNGSAFTRDGPINIRNAGHKTDAAPLDERHHWKHQVERPSIWSCIRNAHSYRRSHLALFHRPYPRVSILLPRLRHPVEASLSRSRRHSSHLALFSVAEPKVKGSNRLGC